MGDQDSDDGLPEGWRVEVKLRKNGRKDKVVFEKAVPDGLPPGWTKEIKITKKAGRIRRDPYYTDPLSGYVFRSKKDALRYVETGELGRLAFKPKDKDDNSMEVEDDKASVGASLTTPAVTKKQKLEDMETKSSTINEQNSKFCGIVKDEVICNSVSAGEGIPVTDPASDQSGLGPGIISSDFPMAVDVSQSNGTSDSGKGEFSVVPAGLIPQLTSSDRPVDKVADQSNGKRDSSKFESSVATAGLGPQLSGSDLPMSNCADNSNGKSDSSNCESCVTPAVEVLPDKQSLENGVAWEEANRTGPRKSKKKKDLNLPRRASKRLAGVPLDPTPELKTTAHGRRTVAGQSDEIAKTEVEDSSFRQPDAKPEIRGMFDSVRGHGMPLGSDEHLNVEVTTPNALAEKDVTISKGGEELECAVVPSVAGKARTEEHVVRVQTDNNINPELLLDLPLGELWQDPCIAFAIQTLTGTSFDNSDGIRVPQELNNIECEGLPTSDQARVGHSEKQCAAVLPLHSVAVPELHTGDVGTVSNADDKPASPHGFPPVDAWADPCIEFAIKTLTDAIPLDYSMVIQDCLPHRSSASQSQENCGMNLPNVGEFCQTRFLCQQFGTSDSPLYNQTGFVEPAIPRPSSTSLRYSGGSGHRGEERSNRRMR